MTRIVLVLHVHVYVNMNDNVYVNINVRVRLCTVYKEFDLKKLSLLTYRFKIQSYKRINGHDTQTYLIHNQCYKKINIHNFEKIQNYKTINIKKINGSIKPADIILKSQSYRKSRTHFWKFNATIKPADTIFQKARFSYC